MDIGDLVLLDAWWDGGESVSTLVTQMFLYASWKKAIRVMDKGYFILSKIVPVMPILIFTQTWYQISAHNHYHNYPNMYWQYIINWNININSLKPPDRPYCQHYTASLISNIWHKFYLEYFYRNYHYSIHYNYDSVC